LGKKCPAEKIDAGLARDNPSEGKGFQRLRLSIRSALSKRAGPPEEQDSLTQQPELTSAWQGPKLVLNQ
jgi:hypothetical protein